MSKNTKKRKTYKAVAPIYIINEIDKAWMDYIEKNRPEKVYPRNFFMMIPDILEKQRFKVFRRAK